MHVRIIRVYASPLRIMSPLSSTSVEKARFRFGMSHDYSEVLKQRYNYYDIVRGLYTWLFAFESTRKIEAADGAHK